MCIKIWTDYACGHWTPEFYNQHCHCLLIVGPIGVKKKRCGECFRNGVESSAMDVKKVETEVEKEDWKEDWKEIERKDWEDVEKDDWKDFFKDDWKVVEMEDLKVVEEDVKDDEKKESC